MAKLKEPEYRKIKCPHYKYQSFDEAPGIEAFLNELCLEEFEIKVDENIDKKMTGERQKCPKCGRNIEIISEGEGISVIDPK